MSEIKHEIIKKLYEMKRRIPSPRKNEARSLWKGLRKLPGISTISASPWWNLQRLRSN